MQTVGGYLRVTSKIVTLPNGPDEQRPDEIPSLAHMRESYGGSRVADVPNLDIADLAGGWLPVMRAWLAYSVAAAIPEPNAMVLATVDGAGVPATRTVLCKGVDESGVTFYTNYGSAKGQDLAARPVASATFPWIGIERQVTFRGRVVRVEPAVTQEYWSTRPRGSQLGAWASAQSQTLSSRAQLEHQLAEVTMRFDGASIPVPPHWGGLRIEPMSVEFWQGSPNRLHNRIRMDIAADGSRTLIRLQP